MHPQEILRWYNKSMQWDFFSQKYAKQFLKHTERKYKRHPYKFNHSGFIYILIHIHIYTFPYLFKKCMEKCLKIFKFNLSIMQKCRVDQNEEKNK